MSLGDSAGDSRLQAFDRNQNPPQLADGGCEARPLARKLLLRVKIRSIGIDGTLRSSGATRQSEV